MPSHVLLNIGTYEKQLRTSLSFKRWTLEVECLRYMLTIYFQDPKRGISLSKTLSASHKYRHSSGSHDNLKRPLSLKKTVKILGL